VELRDLFDIVRDARAVEDPHADDVLAQAGDAAAWYPVLVQPPNQLLLRGVIRNANGHTIPQNVAEWALILEGTGIAPPDAIWTCEPGTGNLVNLVGSPGITGIAMWTGAAANLSDEQTRTILEATGFTLPVGW
jgi:hypothetical protein